MAKRTLGRCGLLLAAVLAGRAAGDQVQDIINQASVGEYQSYMRVLTGVDPVPGQLGVRVPNRYALWLHVHLAEQYIADEFQSFGLSTSLHPFPITGSQLYGQNVVGELPGTTRPQDIYVICGHYDAVEPWDDPWMPQPVWRMPGADDNASGTAAVLAAARVLSQYQFEGTIRFIAFSAEEEGLYGSEAYAHTAHEAGENIVATINLDMILHPGFDDYETDPDYDLDIAANTPSQWLAEYLVGQYTAYTSLAVQVQTEWWVGTDCSSFWWEGYHAVGLSENTDDEIWGGSNAEYHRITDLIDNPHLDWDFGLQGVRGAMAGLIGLAGLVPVPDAARAPRHRLGFERACAPAATNGREDTTYVDDDAPLGGDGTTWNTAFRYLQDALAVALPGQEIHVAQGTYKPDQSETGVVTPGDTQAAFQIGAGLGVLGGYQGCPGGDCSAVDPDQRDVAQYKTILSGDLLGNDGSEWQTWEDNSRRVVRIEGADNNATLDGLTIRGAWGFEGLYTTAGNPTVAQCTFTRNYGSAVRCAAGSGALITNCAIIDNDLSGTAALACQDSQPIIQNCVVSGNVSDQFGGSGVGIYGGQATIAGCAIVWNASFSGGGGLGCAEADVFVSDSTIAWNQAGGEGAGIRAGAANLTLTHCTISNNWAWRYPESDYGIGGGIYCNAGANVTASDCVLVGNFAGESGGAIYSDNNSVLITDSVFAGNLAPHAGGGAYLVDQMFFERQFVRCTFTGNEAAIGGAICSGSDSASLEFIDCAFSGNDYEAIDYNAWDSHVTIGGCSFVGNTRAILAGLSPGDTITNCTFRKNEDSYPLVTYGGAIVGSILWDDGPAELPSDSDTLVSFSDVQGGWAGPGNTNADPLFATGSSGVWTGAGAYDPDSHRVTLTDAGAAWTAGALAGQFVNPDTSQTLAFVIVDNTATTLTIWGDWASINRGASWVSDGASYEVYDLHLTSASPCINGGNNYAPGLPDVDLDGAARIQQCRVDMGAYESPFAPPTFLDCNQNGVNDDCDIYDGTSQDGNHNGIPDECEAPPVCIGDLNCDGMIDFGDINPFVSYVSDFAAWQAAFPGCQPRNGDINCDGTYGQAALDDINPFVALMTQLGGQAAPCPGPLQCP